MIGKDNTAQFLGSQTEILKCTGCQYGHVNEFNNFIIFQRIWARQSINYIKLECRANEKTRRLGSCDFIYTYFAEKVKFHV